MNCEKFAEIVFNLGGSAVSPDPQWEDFVVFFKTYEAARRRKLEIQQDIKVFLDFFTREPLIQEVTLSMEFSDEDGVYYFEDTGISIVAQNSLSVMQINKIKKKMQMEINFRVHSFFCYENALFNKPGRFQTLTLNRSNIHETFYATIKTEDREILEFVDNFEKRSLEKTISPSQGKMSPQKI